MLRSPRKANETPAAAGEVTQATFIWRTPTREHLAEVVHGQGLKE
jgi:hypothetical protein